ncbi:MAG: hypothetical protein RIR00_765 [Pseudomonadota bacterium]|jgi:PAS domain S-box-containing protein
MLQIRENPTPPVLAHCSPQRVARLLQAIPSPMFFNDLQGVCLDCNDAFCRAMGLARASLLGRPLFELMQPCDDRGYRRDQAMLSERQHATYATQVRLHDGRQVEVMFTRAVVCDQDGVPCGFVAIMVETGDFERLAGNSHLN